MTIPRDTQRRRITREFGARLRMVRKATDWALWDAARLAGMDSGRLHEMESGQLLAKPLEMDRLAEAFGCDRQWLETGEVAANVQTIIDDATKARSGVCPASAARVAAVLAAFLRHDLTEHQRTLGFHGNERQRDGET